MQASPAACWSMLMVLVTLRLWGSRSSVWSPGPGRWWWWWWWGYCEKWLLLPSTWRVADADQQVFTMPITRRAQATTYCLSQVVTWLIVKGPRGAIFLPFMFSLIRCRSVSHLWFMSESCSLWCCRRGTLTRESDWLFVLSIIREYIQFTPFITPGPGDKWWGGLF